MGDNCCGLVLGPAMPFSSVARGRTSGQLAERFYTILISHLGDLRYSPQLMESATLELQQAPASQKGTVVTRLNGKLALETVNSFIQTMRQEPAAHLVLDMSGLSFLDSSGVGALVSLFVSRKHAGKTLVLANLTKQGTAVLQVSGLMKLIPTYSTVEEALKSSA
jgi:anti-anti-sigma factor